MTVIAAAITRRDGVVIVGDSELTWDYTKDDDGSSKLWVAPQHQFIFGGCGNVRSMQVIKHWVDWPHFRDDHDVEEFMVKEVVTRIREALQYHGAMSVSKRTESFDGSIIMAWQNNLAVIDDSFGVAIPASGRYAIGSGISEALGSLGNTGPWSKGDVIEAARRATLTALGVGGPLWVTTTRSLQVEQIQ